MLKQRTIQFYRENNTWGELSNFYLLDSPITYKDNLYSTSEHLYQCLKYLYEGASDENVLYAEEIRRTTTPFKAKILANKQRSTRYEWQRTLVMIMDKYPDAHVKPDWEHYKDTAMMLSLRLKFNQNVHCRQTLLCTGDKEIVENSPDNYWGSGRYKNGNNQLGKLLMTVRQDLLLLQDSMNSNEPEKELPDIPDEVLTHFVFHNDLEDYLEKRIPDNCWFSPPEPPFDLESTNIIFILVF